MKPRSRAGLGVKFKNDANGSYAPYLSGSALGATAPRTGEGFRQISVDINYWF
jgi:hypothetical protein